MVDFGSKISGYVKNEAQTFAQKTVNDLVGNLTGIGGGVINSLIGSVASGLSQNLMDIGNAFNVIEAVAAQKLDGIVAGGDPEYASGGRCGDRSTISDISSARNPGGTLRDYSLNTFPETRIEDSMTEFTNTNMIVLTEASEKYYLTLRFYKYDRQDLFKEASKNTNLYQVTLPLPMELLDNHRVEFSTPDMKTVGNLLQNGVGQGTVTAGGLNSSERIYNATVGTALGALNIDGIAQDNGLDARNVVNVIEQYLGVAPNPHPSYVFEGPSLREFTFSWMFNPRNAEESGRIKTVINKMKSSSLPATTFNDDTGLLKYPHVALLNFYPWDSGSDVSSGGYGWGKDSFIKLKRCVISNISTNFAPMGSPSFFAGTNDPVYIQMNITFKEIEFFLAHDLDSANKGIGFNDFPGDDIAQGVYDRAKGEIDLFKDRFQDIYDGLKKQ